MIFPNDRDLAGLWAEAGAVPDDLSTRIHAAQLCARLVAAHDELNGIITELLAADPAPAPHPGQQELELFGDGS